MPSLEIFFDYACPYCYQAHKHLVRLIPRYPHISIAWRPCEAHPRPERYGPHSDLCVRGMFFARENGADLWAYHERIYRAIHVERVRVEDLGALSRAVHDLLDADAFRPALERGDYADALRRANDYAYGQSGVWVVPAYRAGGKRLDAIEDIGVTALTLETFLRGMA